MNDSISRQKTIEEVDKYFDGLPIQGHYDIVQIIKNMPTIEPKRGKWIAVEYNDGTVHTECSVCGYGRGVPPVRNYCPNCGAKMDGDEWEEHKINPCLGCEDYDGRGGCKSHGGCGAERNE